MSAQDFPFEFEVLTSDYTPLSEPISLTNDEVWDDPNLSIPLGFEFNYFGYPASKVYIDEEISLDAMVSTVILKDFTTNIFMPFEADIIDAGYIEDESESEISYQISGTEPNRICKIQWENCAFYEEYNLLGTLNYRINFQMWLYEGSGDIEFRYGDFQINNPEVNIPEMGFPMGLIGQVSLMTEYFGSAGIITGEESSPMIFEASSVDEILSATLPLWYPEEGTVYRFTNNYVGVSELTEKIDVLIYPSPFETNFTIDSDNKLEYSLYDLAGEEILTGITDKGKTKVVADALDSGIYLLRLRSGSEVITKKIVKK